MHRVPRRLFTPPLHRLDHAERGREDPRRLEALAPGGGAARPRVSSE
jgi:hypothetical protein